MCEVERFTTENEALSAKNRELRGLINTAIEQLKKDKPNTAKVILLMALGKQPKRNLDE
jgi:hypothetical protein